MTARSDVLQDGLVDWVPLERIHWSVSNENKGQPASAIRTKVVDLITDLVTEGLFVIGDTTGEGGVFVPWKLPLADALSRIREVYIDDFDESNTWGWAVWLDLTDKGQPVAEKINAEWRASQADS
ncbi:hypothetical protein FHT40_001913 [Mycolicibacterium sp. BK556]|uniref:hypothetical protein n=1 Tax=Mycobacteriaceae TaxID=1762 RepID=UPI00105C05F3|nr:MULTISPECIES: hypothetical protein [Mycobacteriaceae]MBB3602280.1 hypothetical protein [Mycolicibacterium sp. BK556]MBB3632032.1 hypothetical protein [Mycolicibacterium sp. BK607]TDO18678.1 hypothetical protein EV580_1866 [Mycobacterium sp. BK086]